MKDKILSILKAHAITSLILSLLFIVYLLSKNPDISQFDFTVFYLISAFFLASISFGPINYVLFASNYNASAGFILIMCLLTFLSIAPVIYWVRKSCTITILYISSACWSIAGGIAMIAGMFSNWT